MTILEIGIVNNGLLIFRNKFHKKIDFDPTLIAEKLFELVTIVKLAFDDNTKELNVIKLKNITICILQTIVDGFGVIFYALCDSTLQDDAKPVLQGLIQLERELLKLKTPFRIHTSDITKNIILYPLTTKIFRNLPTNKIQRARAIFG